MLQVSLPQWVPEELAMGSVYGALVSTGWLCHFSLNVILSVKAADSSGLNAFYDDYENDQDSEAGR